MSSKDTVIFIVADEARYGGEADYMKGISAELKRRGCRKDTEYLVYKTVGGGGDPHELPLNNEQYAVVPCVDKMDASVLQRTGKISIIGAGHSTLDTVTGLAAQTGGKATASYITHMVDDRAHLQKIVENDVTLFATTARHALCGIDHKLGAEVKFVALDAVPHTISKASCEIEYDAFVASLQKRTDPDAAACRTILEGEGLFAFALLDAGFEVGKEGHVPYTAAEAARAGAALGAALPPYSNLIIAEGSPRNLMDRKTGEDTMNAFAKAYKHAQMDLVGTEDPDGPPYVAREFYKPGLSYNVVKAGYILGGRDNCVAFISNSEGYSTMDGAVMLIDNRKKLLGMFSSNVQYADETGQHQANIEKYNKRGIAILRERSGLKLDVSRHSQQQATPAKVENAAEKIVQTLRLVQAAAGLSPKHGPKNNNM